MRSRSNGGAPPARKNGSASTVYLRRCSDTTLRNALSAEMSTWDPEDQDLGRVTVECTLQLLRDVIGTSLVVIAPRTEINHLKVHRADGGELTRKLQGLRVWSDEFRVLFSEFCRRRLEDESVAHKGKDGAILIGPNGLYLDCLPVKLLQPPKKESELTFDLGPEHDSALALAHLLKRSVVLLRSQSGSSHCVLHDNGHMMVLELSSKGRGSHAGDAEWDSSFPSAWLDTVGIIAVGLAFLLFLVTLFGSLFMIPRHVRIRETQKGPNCTKSQYKTLLRAAVSYDADAWYRYGLMLRKGSCGLLRDEDEAVVWLRKAAYHEHTAAQIELALATGGSWLNGTVCGDPPSSVQEVAFWIQRAATHGDRRGKQLLRAIPFLEKFKVAENDESQELPVFLILPRLPGDLQESQTFSYYSWIAEQGCVYAQAKLGALYLQGVGVTKDLQRAIAWFRLAAQAGSADAQGDLGVLYDNGHGVQRDYQQAVYWFYKAAEQGHPGAQTNLGVMYDHGRGVEKNPHHAARWFRKAALNGDMNAQANLGVMYDNGQGVAQDHAEAAVWFHKAAMQGHATAQMNLGVLHDRDHGTQSDNKLAVQWFRKSAEQGEAKAQAHLGLMYYHGKGVEQDLAEALTWFTKGAEQGEPRAQANLGVMYDHGHGVATDPVKAIELFRKAAKQSDASAQANLGVMYDRGHGVTQDFSEALVWFRKAGKQGHVHAQANLGVMYDNGRGVSRDPSKAVAWFRKATTQGSVLAMTNLGIMYRAGRGVAQNHKKAAKLFRLAAKQEETIAQVLLAESHEQGLGITKDVDEAMRWYRKASSSPFGGEWTENAKKALKRLE